jgi:hypothetical protein
MHFSDSYSGSKNVMVRDMTVIGDFLNEEEERSLHEEVEPYMRRLRYEFDHWDDVSKSMIRSSNSALENNV